MTASTATPALSLLSSVAAATASIKSFLLICTVLRIFENVSGEWVRSRPNFRGMATNGAAQAQQRARNNAQSPPASSGKSQEKRRFWGENRGSTAPSCIGGKVNADLR